MNGLIIQFRATFWNTYCDGRSHLTIGIYLLITSECDESLVLWCRWRHRS